MSATAQTLTIKLPQLHAGQRRVSKEARRFNVLACGRRWGKTTFGVDRLVHPALQGYPVGWFSPTYKMLSDVWREFKTTLAPITRHVSTQEHRLELITGGIIDMWSLDNPDAARGRKYKRIGVDEAAMIRELQQAWQAVLRPTLTDFEGDAWFKSTPKGMNFFRTIFQWGQDASREDWQSWQMPTSTNPFIKATEIEKARLELPERIFAQEYLAVFLDDAGGVFRRVLDAAVATEQTEAIPGHQYVIGVDWGKHNDFTVLTVLDATDSEVVFIDRFNQIDYQVQLSRLAALCQRFNTKAIVPERNSIGEPLIEQLQRTGYSVYAFTTTNASKTEAIDALALAFERGDLKIINDPVLVAELQAYEAERMPSGLLKYGAPEGMHDDCVMSLAMAWSQSSPSQGAWF